MQSHLYARRTEGTHQAVHDSDRTLSTLDSILNSGLGHPPGCRTYITCLNIVYPQVRYTPLESNGQYKLTSIRGSLK